VINKLWVFPDIPEYNYNEPQTHSNITLNLNVCTVGWSRKLGLKLVVGMLFIMFILYKKPTV